MPGHWERRRLALLFPHKSLWACWQRGAHRTAAGGREQPPDGCTPVTNSDFRSRRRRPRRRPSDSMIDATARAARVARPAKRGRRTSSRTTTRTTTRARSGASAHNVPTQPQKDLWGKGRASAVLLLVVRPATELRRGCGRTSTGAVRRAASPSSGCEHHGRAASGHHVACGLRPSFLGRRLWRYGPWGS